MAVRVQPPYLDKFTPIITSMLDTDLYKFTMMQVVLHHFSGAKVQYEFHMRNYPNGTLDGIQDKIDEQLDHLCTLRFTEEELEYMSTMPWFTDDFIEYLRMFKFNRNYIKTYVGTEDDGSVYKKGEFRITIEGPWLTTILFETPVLAIVSECLTFVDMDVDSIHKYVKEGEQRLQDKIQLIKDYGGDIKIVDFGTRRRFARRWHEGVVKILAEELPDNFIGTSNVDLARRYNLKPIGTMAHEFIQASQALIRLIDSQKYAFQVWADEYRGDLGIALSDCMGMDAFLNDFDKYFSKLFDGARHDSGDPYEWCDKLLAHYESAGIDSRTKTAVFSDGLNFERAIAIDKAYKDKINVSFGIGTYLTNDTGFKAPQIVIKMTKCNGQPVAKISDSKGKMMCKDEDYLNYLAGVFKIENVWGVE